LADAGGGIQQHSIMENLPFLGGRSSASLRALKSHVNAGCKALDCAPLLAEGSGTGDFRIHEINPALGALRTVVIQEAKAFDIPWHLLERPTPKTAPPLGPRQTEYPRPARQRPGMYYKANRAG
jgi:hypothetical protein